MDFGKALGIVNQSIQSLRWWAFAVMLTCSYMKFMPNDYRSVGIINFTSERVAEIDTILLAAAVIFFVGWLAYTGDKVIAKVEENASKKAVRRAAIEARRKVRREKWEELRSIRASNHNKLRNLTPRQLIMTKSALGEADGILKVANDAALDVATTLVTKNVFDRIRPWYNERGGVVGEVFVVNDWVKEAALVLVFLQGEVDPASILELSQIARAPQF